MTRSSPAISVLMVAHNAGDFLVPAVRSVLQQSFGNLELVLIDNASTDGSTAALPEEVRDVRLVIHRLPQNLGPIGGARAGLPFCRAEWLATMDADDVAGHEWLAALREYMAACPGIDLATTLAEEIDAAGARLGPAFSLTVEEQIRAYAEFDMPVRLNTALMRRSLIERVGLAADFSLAGDYDFVERVLRNGRVDCLPEVHHFYRVHSASITTAGGTRQAVSAAFVRERIGLHRHARPVGAASLAEERAMLAAPPTSPELHRIFLRRAIAARLPAGAIFHARRLQSLRGVLRGLALAREVEPQRFWFHVRLAAAGPLFAIGARSPLHNRFGRRRATTGRVHPMGGPK